MEENKNSEQSFLSVEDLSLIYTSDGDVVHAVNGVSFQLARKSTLGLVGETGAGKTSIAKAIMRILPDYAAKVTGGRIMFEGQNIMELPEEEMRKIRGNKISMIFQDPMTALNPIMTVGSQIAEAVRLHNDCTKAEARKRATDMIQMVGIPADRYGEYPHQFSGGMKQRCVIALALACNPELLLADEPTTALDVTIQAQVLSMMNDLKKKTKAAMILITHDLGVVAEMCDNVAVVYAGEIVEYGSKEEIFKHPTHPYTKGLFGALPNMNEGKSRLTMIKGTTADPTNLPKGCKFCPRCEYAGEACAKAAVDLKCIGGTHLCRCLNVGKGESING